MPATLALTLGRRRLFGAFTPGVDKDYKASTHGDGHLDRGDAALSVSDRRRSPTARSLAQPRGNHAGEDELERRREQRHVGDRVQAVHRPDRAAAHRPYSADVTFTLSTTTP